MMVAMCGSAPTDSGSMMEPMSCIASPMKPFNVLDPGHNWSTLIPILVNASQNRTSEELLLSINILHVV